jgi:pimeloyl-ACP methyl ester carboxylesterase
MLRTIALAALALLLPAAATAAPAVLKPTGAVTWGDCPLALPAGIRCGKVDVPENWSKPNGRRISVTMAVVPASKPLAGPKPEPTLFLTGGPGFSAMLAIQMLGIAPLAETRDLIVVEPRGFGYSEPGLVCPGRYDHLVACRARFDAAGVDTNQYTSTNISHDLEAVRQAVGAPHWNVLGVSYGTFLALTYARLHPEGIRSLILDSPYPPQAGYDWTRASALNGFGRVFDACKADKACDKAYPDLRNRFIAALRKAEAEQAVVNGHAIGGGVLFERIYKDLYMSPSLALAPGLTDQAARGELAALFPPKPASNPAADRAFAGGVNAAVMCADDIPFKAAPDARVAFHSPWPKDIVAMIRPEGWNYDRICKEWPAKAEKPVINAAVHSDLPSLILVGAMDPITPPEFGEAMALTLPNATLMVDPQASHAVITTGHPCIMTAVARFLDDPGAHVDTSCLAATPVVKWKLPG